MRTSLIRTVVLNIWHLSKLLKCSVLEEGFVTVKCQCCVFLKVLLNDSWLKNQDMVKEVQACMMLVVDSMIRK